MLNKSMNSVPMEKDAKWSYLSAAETVKNIAILIKRGPRELGIYWSGFVILATLASPGIAYLSTSEIIEKTGMDRCWVYRNLRLLLQKGLIDSVKQPGAPKKVRVLYTVNGKGSYYLTQALTPRGISMIKALEQGRS